MSNKLTTKEFIQKARKVHGDKYNYSQTKYINSDKKVVIVCNIHGKFSQLPYNHIGNKQGCPTCSGKKKLTTKEFIQKAQLVHGNKYNYKMVDYKNNSTKVIIICRKHGKFLQQPNNHLEKQGCPICGGTKKKNTKSFIKEAKCIHGNKYNYNKVNYKDAVTKVIINCQKHGHFLQTPDEHVNGKHGCPECGGTKKYTKEQFIIKSKQIHGNKYNYNKIIYKNSKSPVLIKCRKHGLFKQTPYGHLKGNGCPKCAIEKLSKKHRSNSKEFIQKAIRIHNGKYSYKKTKYIKAVVNVLITCKKHGIFSQTPNSHLNGQGCPKCNIRVSKQESLWLNSHNIPDDKNHRQVCLKINGKRFEVDGYIPETKTIYEFLGDYYHGNPNVFNLRKYNTVCHKTFGQLYELTLQRIKTFKKNGYEVKYIWENDYKKQLK